MGPSLWLMAVTGLLVLQGESPRVEVSVDEDRVSVGEEILFVLRAESHSPVPLQVTVAPFNGLETVSRSERSEVTLGPTPTRTTVLEVRLRAVRPGRWQLGPARAVQGRDTVEAAALVVDVSASRAATASTLNPRLRQLLDRAVPPSPGQAGVDLLVSADSAEVGEQVDVVTCAWFPRDLRLQLRRPPTLQPPVIDGVWSYPQATPSGIAATRSIGGHWYDLFVAHQVVFPLVSGKVEIPRATLKYGIPVALQFFSQEERYALTSRAATLRVSALPAEGRPSDFAGAVASELKVDRRITPSATRVGEGVSVELALAGEGNIALWPAPETRWPRNARAYLERVDEQVSNTGGRVGGTKTYRYLLVPDSAGALALPAMDYPYFDLAAHHYQVVSVPVASVPVAPAGETAVSAALPPALMSGESPALSWRIAHGLPDWVWFGLILLPPLAVAARGRLPARPRRPAAGARPSDLRNAEEALDALVRNLVPDPDRRAGARLVAAMRAAGADAELAGRVVAARERLLARRYGPGLSVAEDPALAAEIHDLVRRLGGSLRGWVARGAAILLLVVATGESTAAQSPPPEDLYQAGSLAAAAAGFGRRTEESPAVAANWYNLGATFYRLGREGRAAAAWLEARRLKPRAAAIRRALALTPPPDDGSLRWTWSPPVTPEELLLIGGLGWVVGWIGWWLRPRARDRWSVLLIFALCGMAGGLALRAWYRRPLAIVLDRTTLRVSPHGLAPPIAALDPGSALWVVRQSPGWLLVRAPGSREGWVAREAVAAVGG